MYIHDSRINDLSLGRVTSSCVEQLAKGNDMSSLYLWQIDCKYAISFLIKIPFWCGCKFCTGIRCSCTRQDAVQIATLQRSETRETAGKLRDQRVTFAKYLNGKSEKMVTSEWWAGPRCIEIQIQREMRKMRMRSADGDFISHGMERPSGLDAAFMLGLPVS